LLLLLLLALLLPLLSLPLPSDTGSEDSEELLLERRLLACRPEGERLRLAARRPVEVLAVRAGPAAPTSEDVAAFLAAAAAAPAAAAALSIAWLLRGPSCPKARFSQLSSGFLAAAAAAAAAATAPFMAWPLPPRRWPVRRRVA